MSLCFFCANTFAQEAAGSDRHENDTVLPIDPSLVIAKSTVNLTTLTNYPNPIRTSTTIQYNVPANGHVSIKVYKSSGQVVSIVFDGYKNAGTYKDDYNASNDSMGTYVCRLSYPSNNTHSVTSQKMYVIK